MMKKEMTRNLFFYSTLALIFFSMFGFVGAADGDEVAEGAAATTRGVVQAIGGVANEALGPLFGDQEILTRIFFFILLYMIIYNIVGVMFHFDEHTFGGRFMAWGVPAIIALLAMIALPANFIEAIRTSYGAMGAAILSVIPFIILLIFTFRVHSLLVGRMVWLFFVVYYFALYIYSIVTAETIGDGWTGWITAETIPYIAAIVAGLLIFFGLAAFRNMYFRGEMQAVHEAGRQVAQRGKLLHKLQREELEQSYEGGGGI
jgi:hypothetical protein